MPESRPPWSSPQVYADDQLAYDTWWEAHKEMPVMRDDVSFIVDFGAIRNAYIAMHVEGNRDATIDVAWGQTLIDGQVQPILYSRLKRDAAGRPDHQSRAALALALGGRQQLESINYKNFRYLQVTVRDLTEPLKIDEIAAIRSFVSMEAAGGFYLFRSLPGGTLRRQPAHARRRPATTPSWTTPTAKRISGAATYLTGSVPTALAGYGR